MPYNIHCFASEVDPFGYYLGYEDFNSFCENMGKKILKGEDSELIEFLKNEIENYNFFNFKDYKSFYDAIKNNLDKSNK